MSHLIAGVVTTIWDILLKRAEELAVERQFDLEQKLSEARRAMEVNDMNIFAMQFTESTRELDDALDEHRVKETPTN